MELKVFKLAAKGNMVKVGDATKSMDLAPWIFMTANVISTLPKDIEGKIVTYTTELQKGQKFINKITVVGASQPQANLNESKPLTGAITTTGQEVKVTTQKEGYLPKEEWIAKMKAEGKWNEHTDKKEGFDSSTSKRQTAAHSTGRTLIGMQGILTSDNVLEIMEKVYTKYVELIG